MPQSVAAPSSPDLIRALWVNPAPPGKEPASASTASGKPLSSPAGGEEKEVDPMLEPEDTTACDFLPHHYRIPRLCREQHPLGTGLIALGTAYAERELSAERSRHRWASTGGSAESHGPNSRHSCAESPRSSRHRPIHN
jgi:hypothetical protein